MRIPNPRLIGFFLGIVVLVLMLLSDPMGGMNIKAWRVAAVGFAMVAWWIFEAVPIPVTALLPLLLFPLLGIADINAAAAPYANPIIFLFLGGFILAKALEHTGLHRRIALLTITTFGSRPPRLIAGFMAATAFISMWVSNTATVVMIYPMAMSVIDRATGADAERRDAFPVALLLGICYAANIGGLGTLIGSPPNALLAGFMSDNYGRTIGFADWMLVGVPLILVALPITWWFLVRRLLHEDKRVGADTRAFERDMVVGPMTTNEWLVGIITIATAMLWIVRPLFEDAMRNFSDSGIAIAGAIAIFVVSVFRRQSPLLTWDHAETLPWSVLILFGGGLSLADAVSKSGLAGWIGESAAGLQVFPVVAVMVAVSGIVLMLTELSSNTATAAVFLPIVASIAVGMHVDPMLLALPVALAASCAFMMPIATPPNAIVFASGRLTIPHMARSGAVVNILMLVLINAAMLLIGRYVFSVTS